MNRQCMTRKPNGGNTMNTVLTAVERAWIKAAINMIIVAYNKAIAYHSTKPASKYHTELKVLTEGKKSELLAAIGTGKSNKNQNIIIKHLAARAKALSNVNTKDEAFKERCKVTAGNIIEMNKKLRRIKKEWKQQIQIEEDAIEAIAEELLIQDAESGADRELDYNIEATYEKAAEQYHNQG